MPAESESRPAIVVRGGGVAAVVNNAAFHARPAADDSRDKLRDALREINLLKLALAGAQSPLIGALESCPEPRPPVVPVRVRGDIAMVSAATNRRARPAAAAGDSSSELHAAQQEISRLQTAFAGAQRELMVIGQEAGAARLSAMEAGSAMNMRFWAPSEMLRQYQACRQQFEALVIELIESDVPLLVISKMSFELHKLVVERCSASIAAAQSELIASMRTVLNVDGDLARSLATAALKSGFCHVTSDAYVAECCDECVRAVLMNPAMYGRRDARSAGMVASAIEPVRSHLRQWVRTWSETQCWTILTGGAPSPLSAFDAQVPFDPARHVAVMGAAVAGAPCVFLTPVIVVGSHVERALVCMLHV